MGVVASLLFIIALCTMIWCVRHFYRKKKAYHINQQVHYKTTQLESDVTFNPDLCYETVNENTVRDDTEVYNLTNSGTNASKLSKEANYVHSSYVCIISMHFKLNT